MDFQRGIGEAVTGILGGVVFSLVLGAFIDEGLIPSYIVIMFSLVGFAGALLLMFSFTTAGILFTLGWVCGALLLRDLLSVIDIIVNIVAPIAALFIRGVLWFKDSV